MTTLEILKSARKRIENPENWTRVEIARNAHGEPVEATDESAFSFCAYGSIACVSRNTPKLRALTALSQETGSLIGMFNDAHTHAEVLAAFDAAIAKLEVTR